MKCNESASLPNYMKPLVRASSALGSTLGERAGVKLPSGMFNLL